MMKHEKILRRDDGSRVKIEVLLNTDSYRSGFGYTSRVFSCEKGKRTWVGTYNHDCHMYRKLSMDERIRFQYDSQFNLVLETELQEVRLELWDKIKPKHQR